MKRFRFPFLVLFLVFACFATSGYAAEGSQFYWANGTKVYIDPIPGEYLALYDEGQQEYYRAPYSAGGRSLRAITPPPEISLPSNAALMEQVEESRLEIQSEGSSGKVLRALIPAFRDRETQQMVLPTDGVIIQFQPGVDEETAIKIISSAGLTDAQPALYAPNQFTARSPLGGTGAIDAANALYELPEVKFSHPDMIKGKVHYYIPNDPYYDEEWHLYNPGKGGAVPRADIDVESAWDITRGSITTRLAIGDDGIMWTHEDLIGNFVIGRDFGKGTDDTSPQNNEWHGTAVAGCAVGKGDNGVGISGTCPNCGLVAAAYNASLVSQDAQMFYWENDAGAMISSNSWGYSDNILPDVVRQAITYVTTSGRNGKGIVVLAAAGNESSIIRATSFAGHPNVIAVGASTSEDVRAWYSNFGDALAVMAPSSGGGIDITTTDVYPPAGTGYNPGGASGNYTNGKYTDDFGGTSAATPIAAGVVGLMLTANPQLTIEQVKRALSYTCDKIGPIAYGSDGRNSSYGYGRINARKAVMAALAADHTSWWHDPDEIGSGISIEVQGLSLFLSWYAYDASGRPSWLTSEGTMTDQNHYSGSLLRWTGPPLGSSGSTLQSQTAGTITITFLDNDQATVVYSLTGGGSGTKHMARLLDTIVPKVTTARDVRDIHGWWSTAGASGMDFFIENRNNMLLVTWNNYRDDSTSRWWATGGPFTIGSNLYSGRLDSFYNGQCFGCTYSFPNPIEPLGPVSVQFLSESQAVLTWNGSSYSLTRLLFGATP